MSTRIYKGFRLETDSLTEAHRLIESFRPWVTGQAENLLDTFIASSMKKGGSRVAAFDKWQDLRERVKLKQQRVPHVDTDFTIVLVPAGGPTLGLVYTEHQAWFDAWCALPGVKEYSYWNLDSERPSGVTEDDWAARCNAWNVLTAAPVAMQGYAIELVSADGPLPQGWR